jgi:DNA polymerase I-like protein with 3'-5' exonuclease and polymerase domains
MRTADAPLARTLISAMLEQTKLQTMKQIYNRMEPDAESVLRSFMSPGGTETGRLNHAESFLDPSTNLSNLPNKTAKADPLFVARQCIIPHPGRLLGKADYSQAEARWCAWIAGDTDRIQMFHDGVDQYRMFVSMLRFGVQDRTEEIPKLERNAIGKPGILAGQYGVKWPTLLANINKDADLTGIAIDAKTAKRMEAIIPELFPQTVEWWGRVRDSVLGKGFLTNPFGRKRYFFGRRDSESARDAVVREAIAFGPQSANADMVNEAIRRLHADGTDPALIHMLLQAHDEIVFDCAPRDAVRAARAVKEAMEFEVSVEGRPLVIPVEVNLSSRNWADMKQVA